MNRGYIKLWRRLKDSDFWLSDRFTKAQAWVDLLMLANHKDGFFRVRGQRIDVKRGQLALSEVTLAERWKWSRGRVRRYLSELSSKTEQKIVQQKSNVTTLISIINYEQYQSGGTANSTADGTADGTRSKNVNNEKNEKNKKKAAPPSAAGIELSQHLLDLILSNHPGFKRPSLETWAKHADRMLSIDGRTPEEIKSVMEWAQHDQFWHLNVLSMGTLREKFDRLFLEMGAKNGNHNQGYRRHEKTSAGNASAAGSGENFSAKYDHLGRTLSVDE